MMARDEVLRGKHAVVTGGSRGIGAAVARRLAELGAAVTIVARDRESAMRTAETIKGRAVTGDVTKAADVARALGEAVDASGPVGILVNNVGGVETASFVDTGADLWERMFDINVTPPYLCTKHVLPGMLKAGYGRIVSVASTAGLRGYPYVSAYVAAKHAVVGFTRALAIEVEKKGVTVNAVCPGFTDTELTRASAAAVAERTGKAVDEIIASYAATNAHGRLVRPEEVANGVAWFCLPDQSAVSGRAVAIDGSDEKPEV